MSREKAVKPEHIASEGLQISKSVSASMQQYRDYWVCATSSEARIAHLHNLEMMILVPFLGEMHL
jgi:hypothetical protein